MATATKPETGDPAIPGGGQAKVEKQLRAFVIGLDADGKMITNPRVAKARDISAGETPATKELPPDDLLSALSADGKIIVPPFDKLVLAMLPENSTSLGPVIDAMAQNVDGFGHHLECNIKMDDPNTPDEIKAKVLAERAMLTNWFKNVNPDYSFTELRKRGRTDIEATGESFWEVLRTSSGKIVGFNHIPSYQIYLGTQDMDLTTFTTTTPEVQQDGSRKLVETKFRKRFRRYVQARITSLYSRGATFHRSAETRWFKEFGDPRIIDNKTGEVVKQEDEAKVPEEQRANELVHFKLYSPRTPHGLPRFIGNLITLFGDRAADEVNYNTLKNNNVPSMMITVANGQLTQASIDRIQEYVMSQIAGQNNFSKFIIIEAEGQYEGQESGIPKIGIEKLSSEQMRDQLFQQYSMNNADKIRQAFRLPPIFVGRSDDYTRSTAEASRRLADEQVFSPGREEFDNYINQRVLPEIGALYHTFVSNGPNITDDEDLIAVMAAAEKSGGMTPRIARMLIADILGMDEHALPPLDPSIKPDVPFTIQVADAVKNTAEPMHQLAVKGLTQDSNAGILVGLLKLREELENALLKRKGLSRSQDAA